MNAVAETEPRQRFMSLPARRGEIAYLDLGPQDRPVDVVFCHATGFNGRTYRSVLQPLSHLRILLPDLRGHGASTLPASTDGWPGWLGYRDDLLEFLDRVTERPVVLGGHSMGGTVSLLTAAAEPRFAKALGLFDPVVMDRAEAASPETHNPLADGAARRRASFASREAVLQAYNGRGAFATWAPEQLADYVAGGFRDAEDGGVTLACEPAWEAFTFRMHNYDPFAAFRDSRCPIRILKAEEASTARFGGHEAEIAANPRITVEVVAGTTHFLPMERPERVRETLASLAAA